MTDSVILIDPFLKQTRIEGCLAKCINRTRLGDCTLKVVHINKKGRCSGFKNHERNESEHYSSDIQNVVVSYPLSFKKGDIVRVGEKIGHALEDNEAGKVTPVEFGSLDIVRVEG